MNFLIIYVKQGNILYNYKILFYYLSLSVISIFHYNNIHD